MRAALVSLLAVLLAGCATCEHHRDACIVAAGLVTGAALLAVGLSAHCSVETAGPPSSVYVPPCAKHH